MNKIICLDAGHTPGEDPGACGYGLREADLTGIICTKTATALAAYDCDVRQVPRTDSLAARCNYANEIGAACFVSIHINAGGGTGFESYIWTFDYLDGTAADELQEALHDAVMVFLGQHGVRDRGKKAANFCVLRETDMPAVLLECLFIDNADDAAKLKNELYLNGIANAIAWGIVKAMGLTLRTVDETEVAIAKLQSVGVIVSPEYWIKNAKPGGSCAGGYVARLIQQLASKL